MVIQYTLEHLKRRLTTPYLRGETPTNDNWLLSVIDGLWAYWEEDRDIVQRDILPATAIGPALDRHARAFLVTRNSGEIDASLRLRLYGEIRKRLGLTQPDKILEFLAAALQLDASTLTLVENTDATTGKYRPAYYYITFDAVALVNLGWTSDQVLAAVAVLNNILAAASAAGVKGEILILAGAEWDTDFWDAVAALWSSIGT
jgi:hypothetical protein